MPASILRTKDYNGLLHSNLEAGVSVSDIALLSIKRLNLPHNFFHDTWMDSSTPLKSETKLPSAAPS
jgi:hypothetical protein